MNLCWWSPAGRIAPFGFFHVKGGMSCKHMHRSWVHVPSANSKLLHDKGREKKKREIERETIKTIAISIPELSSEICAAADMSETFSPFFMSGNWRLGDLHNNHTHTHTNAFLLVSAPRPHRRRNVNLSLDHQVDIV